MCIVCLEIKWHKDKENIHYRNFNYHQIISIANFDIDVYINNSIINSLLVAILSYYKLIGNLFKQLFGVLLVWYTYRMHSQHRGNIFSNKLLKGKRIPLPFLIDYKECFKLGHQNSLFLKYPYLEIIDEYLYLISK